RQAARNRRSAWRSIGGIRHRIRLGNAADEINAGGSRNTGGSHHCGFALRAMTEARTTSSPAGWRSWMADYLGLVIALGGLILIFSLTTKHFFSPETFRTIANQIPAALLVATGMTFVLIVAEIDLSVG